MISYSPDVDECLLGVCTNGGRCLNTIGGYMCQCLVGWTGPNCRKSEYIKKLSRHMGKPIISIGENKGADQLRSNCEADQRLCFRHSDSTIIFLFYLNPKFQASSSFLCLYRSVCVGPGQKPHCWFSHEVAQMKSKNRESENWYN